ncbi:hypothetical protein AN403_5863 [Pseudomonas fluorescens]|uniref:Uncharacterized protein n=2 Tax=Pseudomonas fluorescens TaxID=294 RepID=A0A0P8XMM5_PSEFL|nr:hypothetical protein AN403_5863 [Pseudomonas fluorescens]
MQRIILAKCLKHCVAMATTPSIRTPPTKGFFTHSRETVGAGSLAIDSNAPRLSSSRALSLTTIAGKPAPTGDRVQVENEVASKPVKAPTKSPALLSKAGLFFTASDA